MSNFNEKSNAIKKAETILEQCREREIISESKIRKSLMQNNYTNEHTEKRVKRIFERQRKKIKFWRVFSIIAISLFIISLAI